VYGVASRSNDTRLLLDEATVAVVFAWVFTAHRRLVSPRS
jgi:hypothetical protein